MKKPHNESGDKNRTVTVRVRVKPSEKLQLQNDAANAGLTVSEWLRFKALNAKPYLLKPNPQQEVLLRLLAELGKQGSLLNQLARYTNTALKKNAMDDSVPMAVIVSAVENVKVVVNTLRKALEQ